MDLEDLKKQLENNSNKIIFPEDDYNKRQYEEKLENNNKIVLSKNKTLSTLFLKSKFGDMECKYHCYKDYKQIGGDLKEILDEFQMFLKQIKK